MSTEVAYAISDGYVISLESLGNLIKYVSELTSIAY